MAASEIQVKAARRALYDFWGNSNGALDKLAAVERQIREAGITQKQILNELIPTVPAEGNGITGQRCRRTVAMLRRLAAVD